jgi:xanthine dehydrogenase accessory factor
MRRGAERTSLGCLSDAPLRDTVSASALSSSLTELCHFFANTRWRGESYVLATIIRTEGSTYRKAGARILIAQSGIASGLLSGGCLEADVRERAARVLATGRPELAIFDSRTEEDALWGTGLGCEGVNHIWLQPVTAATDFTPLPYLARCFREQCAGSVATVIGGEASPDELGLQGCTGVDYDDPLAAMLSQCRSSGAELQTLRYRGRALEVFVGPVVVPPALLLCGAGPDAIPVARIADLLGWRLTVYDHRPTYAVAASFPESATVMLGRPEELRQGLQLAKVDAAVIMSHHLASDIEYLRQLATEDPPAYIGLLGPTARRKRIFDELGPLVTLVVDRVHAPVGLDIGATTPAGIALAVIAEIHATQAGKVPVDTSPE